MGGAPWGGSEELWVKTADLAVKEGYSVVASVYNWGRLHPKITELKKEGVTINFRKRTFYGNTPVKRIAGFVVKRFFSEAEIRRLEKYKPDVIIISQGTIYECMSPAFADLQKTTGAKLIIITQANTEYETLPPECFKTGRELFKQADYLYFVSKRNLQVAERQLAMKLNNANVISNPPNLNSYNICKWKESSITSFACVGRLNSAVKGLGVILEILGQPQWEERNWELNLYGKGEDEDYLKELTRFYKLEKKVNFKGFIKDIRQVWDQNHVLLMPSTLEGTPLSLIEAMHCGRTAVVSDVGGNAELIEEGKNGFVAEAPSVNSFGKAMERMWLKKAELKNIGFAANTCINKKESVNSYEQVIREIEKR
jgi:L-malate glycosyltransferase